jgi:hypothetical protein
MRKIMTSRMVSLGLMLAFSTAFGQRENPGSADTKAGYGSTVSSQEPGDTIWQRLCPRPRKARWK